MCLTMSCYPHLLICRISLLTYYSFFYPFFFFFSLYYSYFFFCYINSRIYHLTLPSHRPHSYPVSLFLISLSLSLSDSLSLSLSLTLSLSLSLCSCPSITPHQYKPYTPFYRRRKLQKVVWYGMTVFTP